MNPRHAALAAMSLVAMLGLDDGTGHYRRSYRKPPTSKEKRAKSQLNKRNRRHGRRTRRR